MPSIQLETAKCPPNLDAGAFVRFLNFTIDTTKPMIKPWTSERCWFWEGYRDRKGYGQFKYKGKSYWAHRLSYRIFVGPIPDQMTIGHTCNNASCVNPNHLSLQSRSKNVAEGNRRRKGRKRK